MPGVIEMGGEGDSIKVFVRVRPPCDDDRIELGSCLTVNSQRNAIIMNSKPEPKVFTYDHIADIYTTQETVFNTIGKPLIESCVAGYNGTIFAYGQTGSGKTFTMIGPSEDCDNFQHAQRGVIPHSFEQLFALIKKEQLIHGAEMVEFLCRCSFLEIYNEQVYDLLDPTSTGLQLRENIKRGVFVDGLIERSVTSACDAYQVLAAGWANRTVAATSMNRESSRSHAVFTLHIESKKKMEDGVWHVRSSQLNLVDLAGSERQKDTHTIGVRLKEAGSINKSLSALGNVIMALGGIAHGKSRHVPYRDSKLSFLLRDSLGGNAKTHMIACVHPGARCFGETLSTLQFASRAKTIKNKAVVNEDAHGSVPSLQAEIRRLKLALLQVNSGVGQKDTSSIESSDLAVSVPATKWKDCFLQAMLLREQLQEGMTVSRENYTRLEQACSRKDQALRQSRMVLKFREDALRKLEKAHKEKVDVTTDDKDAIIVALRNEVQTLQQLVDQHPDVTAYKLMTESLKADVELAHKQMRHTTEMTEKKAHELEAVYRQLQAQHNVLDAPTRRSSVSTPQTSQESALSTATLERLKSQNSKQQTELESLRKELATERNNSQRALIEHEAQLVSLRRGRDELEKVLKSHQVHMQMERQARQDMHLKTLKTMTTPKKAKYNLRNRTVLVEASGNAQPHTPEIPRLNLDMSFDGMTTNDDDIMAETAPPEWIGETLDALTDEIQQLQEENRYLRIQLESKEADTVLMVEKFSQLDSQKLQTQQLYESAKDVWTATEEELQQTINRLTKELKDANFSAEVAQDEAKDLWVMVGGLDKQVKETQQTEKTLKDTNNTHTAALKTKILQLEMEVTTLQKESSELSEELTSVKEHEETLQTTLDFNLEQQTELEQQLKAQFTAVEQLQTQLKLTVSSQQQAETKNQQLVSQLQQEAGKEEQLLVALQQVETLQAEVESMRATITSLEGEVKELQGQLDQKSAQIDHLKKTNQEKQDALQSVSATLTEQKQRLQVAECQLEGVTRQLDETVEHSEALQATCRTMEEAVDQLREDLDTQQAKFEETLQKKDVEVELLNEDLQDQLDCNNKALNELQMANQMNEQLTAQLDKIKQLSAVSAEKSEESASKELDLKERLEILKSAHQVQLEEFNSVKEELMAKNQQLEKQLLVVEKANADLVSHQNLKQKIHYHAQLKEANIQLIEKLRKATDEATKYKQLYLKNTGKENVPC